MADFHGQVALVTGAGRGIGRAVALQLARSGADVAVCDVQPQGERVAQEVRDLGRRALWAPADVSRADQVEQMVASRPSSPCWTSPSNSSTKSLQ